MSENIERLDDEHRGLVQALADDYGVPADKLWKTLKYQCFRQRDGGLPSDMQMLSLCVVAKRYNLNPILKELYAFSTPDGGIVPVLGVDGWVSLVQRQPDYRGVSFVYSEQMLRPEGSCVDGHAWIEAVIHREKMEPFRVREYLDEVYVPGFGEPGAWQTHTKRMHRHKAYIQAARIAYGFSGLYDPDEATRITRSGQVASIGEMSVNQDTPVAAGADGAIPELSEFSEHEVTLHQRVMSRARDSNHWREVMGWVKANSKLPPRLQKLLLHELQMGLLSHDLEEDLPETSERSEVA